MGKTREKMLVWFTVILLCCSVTGQGNSSIGTMNQVYAETTVYVTRTGSKYHTHKCGNGTYYATTLSKAKARGLEPCKKCYGSGQASSGGSSSNAKKQKIKLNYTTRVLVTGQSVNLKLKGTSAKVTWKSSNKKIAKVSKKGKVTAKKKGRATITASSKGKKYKCKLKVEAPGLSRKAVTLYEGETVLLRLTGCSHDVDWESDDEDIAEVYDGEIYANEPGVTVIRARVHKKVFKCVVTVQENPDE